MKLHTYKDQKILQFTENLLGEHKRKHTIICISNGGILEAVTNLSDATTDELSQINAKLKQISSKRNICMSSAYCEGNVTSILYINEGKLITADQDTIIALYTHGARTSVMIKMEEATESLTITYPDNYFNQKIIDVVECILGGNTGAAESAARQYCHKYGGINFFGYAEHVIAKLLTKGNKKNT